MSIENNECFYCGKEKADRRCVAEETICGEDESGDPAKAICSVCCGENRIYVLSCPKGCVWRANERWAEDTANNLTREIRAETYSDVYSDSPRKAEFIGMVERQTCADVKDGKLKSDEIVVEELSACLDGDSESLVEEPKMEICEKYTFTSGSLDTVLEDALITLLLMIEEIRDEGEERGVNDLEHFYIRSLRGYARQVERGTGE